MEEILGTPFSVFIGLTVCMGGFCAYMTGNALAGTWRPLWNLFPYMIILGFAVRFLSFALFEGHLLSFQAYLIDTAAVTLIALLSFLATRAAKMVAQYPWQYERTGLFGWKEI